MRGYSQLLISDINYGELLYSCWRRFPKEEADRVLADIEALPTDKVAADRDMVKEAARIKAIVSASYADCFAAALALHRNAPLVTGDPELRKLAHTVPLQLYWLGA